MSFLKLSYAGKSFVIPQNDVTTGVISAFFGLDPLGLHLKVFREHGVANVWPDGSGKFGIPVDGKHAEVIGFCRDQEDEEDLFDTSTILSTCPGPSRSTPRALPGSSRRWHQQVPSSVHSYRPSTSGGARIPPGVKLGNYRLGNYPALGGMKGKRKAITKDVMLSKPNVETGYPENLFPVTINLSALPEITVGTVAEAVENMLDNREPVIILNSRGDIIQDMATTRGETSITLINLKKSALIIYSACCYVK